MKPATQDMLARAAPFALYIAFLVVESLLPERPPWLYPVQLGLVAALLAFYWPRYVELHRPVQARPRDWALAVLVGGVVFVLWIQLDFGWATLGEGRGFDATLSGSGADPIGVALRFVGAVAIVPVMEELFWRSFVLRWLERSEFLAVAPRDVSVRSLVICAAVFAAEHHLWLAGLVAGLAYGELYRRVGRLGPVIVAHALTNLALEVWVLRTGDWALR